MAAVGAGDFGLQPIIFRTDDRPPGMVLQGTLQKAAVSSAQLCSPAGQFNHPR
ncbi:MAG: hypothetical protein ACOX55_05230 [Christensenellales bacterium]